MGPSMSFPLPPQIAKKLPIPLPICYYFELVREVLANTGLVPKSFQCSLLATLKARKIQRKTRTSYLQTSYLGGRLNFGICLMFSSAEQRRTICYSWRISDSPNLPFQQTLQLQVSCLGIEMRRSFLCTVGSF